MLTGATALSFAALLWSHIQHAVLRGAAELHVRNVPNGARKGRQSTAETSETNPYPKVTKISLPCDMTCSKDRATPQTFPNI